ncbi:MAG: hypothetical protein JMDDDDMK_00444 [Acidobacteria bacterium]|nr:hypothetical protein [Acidobacteriota bacterium]
MPRGLCGLRFLQPRLAQPLHQLLDEFRQVPLLIYATHGQGKVGFERQHGLQSLIRRFTITKLTTGSREQGLHIERRAAAPQKALMQVGARGVVIALTIRVERMNSPVPSRMIGIKLSRALAQFAAALPVARKREQVREVFQCGTVHRVERNGAFRRLAERGEFLAEEQRLREREPGEMIGVPRVHRAPCGFERATERIGLRVEAEPMLFAINHRQHRPAVRIAGRLFDCAFQTGAHRRVFFRRDALEVTEAA